MFIFALIFFIPISLLASGGDGNYDIIPRTINFFIFIALLYFLVAAKIKNVFLTRKADIAEKLSQIEKKLKDSQDERLLAAKKLDEAKEQASFLVQAAKKEAEVIAKKYFDDLDREIKSLEYSFLEKESLERKKMIQQEVELVVNEMFLDDSIEIGSEEFVSIVKEKVA